MNAVKNIGLPQIKLIADLSAVKGRVEKDKEVIRTYEALISKLNDRIYDLGLPDQTGPNQEADSLEYWRLKEELIRHQESLISKKTAIANLQKRADEWEVQFEENSRVVNENFQEAIELAQSRKISNQTLCLLVDGYFQNEQDIKSNQQAKNNLYYQLVEQLNGKKR